MAFHHRKLMEDSIDVNKTKLCDLICVSKHLDGKCSTLCRSVVQFPPTSLPDSIPDLHHKNSHQNLHVYLSISFALLATGLFLFACFSIYKHFRIRRISTSVENLEGRGGGDRLDDDRVEFVDEEHGPVIDHPIWHIRTVGLQASIIESITVCKYKKSDGLVEGTECSVCLNEFEENETLRLLPKCSHAFHIICIDTWLRSHTNCPNCRAVIFSPPTPSPPAAEETDGAGAGVVIVIPQPTILEESESESESLDMENEIREEGEEDFQPIRRSVSVSASIMSAAIDGNSVPKKKLKPSSSLISMIAGGTGGATGGGSSVLQSGIRPCLGNRSFSCNGKLFLSRKVM